MEGYRKSSHAVEEDNVEDDDDVVGWSAFKSSHVVEDTLLSLNLLSRTLDLKNLIKLMR